MVTAQPRNRRKRERTRGELVLAAESLVARHGMDAISIDDITRAADVAKGTFYTHFADKDDLAAAISRHVRNELEARVARVNAGVADAAQRMANGISTLLALAMSEPVRARALLRLEPGIINPASRINAGLLADIELGMKQGRFTVQRVDVAFTVVMGAGLSGVARLSDTGAGRVDDPQAFATALVAAALVALGLRRAEALRISASAMSDRSKERPR